MIVLGCDSAGYALKTAVIAYLEDQNLAFIDCGCNGESVDYPDIAKMVCKTVLESKENRGILICGTGIGISMAANRFTGIRAAVCGDYFSAKYTRKHNDANILCMGGRVIGPGLAIELVDVFLHTTFDGGRHARRIEKIELD